MSRLVRAARTSCAAGMILQTAADNLPFQEIVHLGDGPIQLLSPRFSQLNSSKVNGKYIVPIDESVSSSFAPTGKVFTLTRK